MIGPEWNGFKEKGVGFEQETDTHWSCDSLGARGKYGMISRWCQ